MITELKQKDFIKTSSGVQIKGVKGPGMILVYQNWCGHCVRFKPVYAQLDNIIGSKFPLTAIEGDSLKDQELLSQLVDEGFPTIKYFDKNGFVSKESYSGARDIDSLLAYICKTFMVCMFSK